MNEKMRSLLQLYDNTLAQRGIIRSRLLSLESASADGRLGQVRHMIDLALYPKNYPGKAPLQDRDALAHLGFIQGILWAESIINLDVLRQQAADCAAQPVG